LLEANQLKIDSVTTIGKEKTSKFSRYNSSTKYSPSHQKKNKHINGEKSERHSLLESHALKGSTLGERIKTGMLEEGMYFWMFEYLSFIFVADSYIEETLVKYRIGFRIHGSINVGSSIALYSLPSLPPSSALTTATGVISSLAASIGGKVLSSPPIIGNTSRVC
jgi:hypothetical protein